MSKSFEEFSDKDLELISHALYQTYSSLLLPTDKRADNYDDIPNELQRRINQEIAYRKSKAYLYG